MALKKINVLVTTRAKENLVLPMDEDTFRVRVTVLPLWNQANHAVELLLAKHFGLHQNQVQVVGGHKSRRKVVGILG